MYMYMYWSCKTLSYTYIIMHWSCKNVCCRSKHCSEGERKLRRLRANHIKSLRQLSGKAGRVNTKKHGRNIIQSYTNFDSEVRHIIILLVHMYRYKL